MPTITVTGFPASTKTPGFFANVQHGAGPISAGSQPRTLVLVGGKASGFTATVDTQIVDLLSEDDAISAFGAGSELAIMAKAALKTPGINVKGIAVADNGSPTAATATVTIAGTWSTTGELKFYVGGDGSSAGSAAFTISTSASDTATTIAAAIAAAVTAVSSCFASGGSSLGVATLTAKTTGVNGNGWGLYVDKTGMASGMTCTLAGGSSLPGAGGIVGVRFSGGAGARSVANALATLLTGDYDTVAYADVDATNMGLVKTQVATKAALGSQHYEHYLTGEHTYSTAASLGQSTLNDVRGTVAWYRDTPSAKFVIAAGLAGVVQAADQSNPATNFDGYSIPGVCPPMFPDVSNPTGGTSGEMEVALSNSVTPITTVNGIPTVVRLICTHSKAGSASDYRTIDHSDAKVPDRMAQVLYLNWATEVAPNCPYVQDNPGENDPDPGPGVLTPDGYTDILLAQLGAVDGSQNGGGDRWLIDTQDADMRPVVQYVSAGRHLVASVPLRPQPLNHNVGVNLRNVTAA